MPIETPSSTPKPETSLTEIVTAASDFVKARSAFNLFFPTLAEAELPKLADALVAAHPLSEEVRKVSVRLKSGSQVPLPEAIQDILRKSPKSMAVSEVVAAFEQRGYSSNSKRISDAIRYVLTSRDDLFQKRRARKGNREVVFCERTKRKAKGKRTPKRAAKKTQRAMSEGVQTLLGTLQKKFRAKPFTLNEVGPILGLKPVQLGTQMSALAKRGYVKKVGSKKANEGDLYKAIVWKLNK